MGGPREETAAARAAVGVAEPPAPVLLRAAGADGVSFLHRLLSCDVRSLAPGAGTEGLLLTAKGKVTASFSLFLLPGRVELIAPAEARPGLLAGLSRFVIADDVSLEDRHGAALLLSLVGPRGGGAGGGGGGGPRPPPPAPGAPAGTAAAAGGIAVTAFRHRRAGFPAVDLVAAADHLPALRAAALEAAAALGGGPLSPEGLEVLRVENGVPRLGAEFGEETLPQEAGLSHFVSFTKGCFLGQEPVARLQNRGHTNRGLAGVLLEAGAPVVAAGGLLLHEGKEVGVVTSALFSPALGRVVALALLRHEAAAAETRLELHDRGAVLSCVVTPLPFVQGG